MTEEYLNLTRRLDELKQKRSILLGREEQKRHDREELEKALREAGVDPTKPEQEMQRLEAEISKQLAEATRQVDTFERELQQVWPEETRQDVEKKLTGYQNQNNEPKTKEPFVPNPTDDGSLELL